MITATQLVLHGIGDYMLQSDWMASEKVKRWWPTLAHVIVYTLPFLLLTQRWEALAIIAGTHAAIDHWRLAKYVCYAKNFLAPRQTVVTVWWHPWRECNTNGYHKDKPKHITDWLLIFTDNLMHVIINGVTLHYLG